MNRFPDKYVKPELILINEGLKLGWSALCTAGTNASTGCSIGQHAGLTSGSGLIDPEILHTTEQRRSTF